MERAPIATLSELLDNSTRHYPDNNGLFWSDGGGYSYREFGRQVGIIKHFLREQAIQPGERVAILSENMPNWGVAYFAITTLGAVAVPILPEFHPDAIHHILRHAGCKVLFVSERLYGKVDEFSSDELKLMMLLDDFNQIPPEASKETLSQSLRKVIRGHYHKGEETPDSEVTPDDLACIIYTSGTTGSSKGVMLSHGNLMFDVEAAAEVFPIKESDRFLSILPMSHTYECTLGFLLPLRWGASIHYLKKPPTAGVLLPAMAQLHPTVMLSVPLVIEKIYKMRVQPKFSANWLIRTLYRIPLIRRMLNRMAGRRLLESFGGQLRFFGVGGAALSAETEHFLREAKFPYAIGYGLTETAPLVAGTGPEDTRYRAIGPAFPGIKIRIDSPEPVTGEGELQVKGKNVMQGYYKAQEATDEVFTADGWFRTGDLGYIDNDGYLYIRGRLKNMILGPGGENIYPEEIEGIINEQDVVLESLVFEREGKLIARIYLDYDKLDLLHGDKRLNDTEMRPVITSLFEQIKTAVNGRVANFSRLNQVIEQREPFDKTPTMKIKRFLYVE